MATLRLKRERVNEIAASLAGWTPACTGPKRTIRVRMEAWQSSPEKHPGGRTSGPEPECCSTGLTAGAFSWKSAMGGRTRWHEIGGRPEPDVS
jgi:hypothetical protein